MDLKTQIIQEYLTQGVDFIAVVGRLTNNTLAHHSLQCLLIAFVPWQVTLRQYISNTLFLWHKCG